MSETRGYEELLRALTTERFTASAWVLRGASGKSRVPDRQTPDGAPSAGRPAGGSFGAGKLLLRVEEAAQLLDVGRTRIYELIGSGALRSVKIGGSRRIPAAALQRYVDDLMNGTA